MNKLFRQLALASFAALAAATGCSVRHDQSKEATSKVAQRLMCEATMPISLYRNPEGDYRLTTDPAFPDDPDAWRLVSVEGYVIPPDVTPPQGTLPLYTVEGNEGYLTTIHDEGNVVRLEGYIYAPSDAPTGAMPLHRFITDEAPGGEFSTSMDVGDDIQAYHYSPDYRRDEVWGYIRPAKATNAALQPAEAYQPIFQYWDEERETYRLSTAPELPHAVRLTQEGFVFPANEHVNGTVALYSWLCDTGSGPSYVTTTDPGWGPGADHHACEFLAIEGHVFEHPIAGTVPLDVHVRDASGDDPAEGVWFTAAAATSLPEGYDWYHMKRNGYFRPVGSAATHAPKFIEVTELEPSGRLELVPGQSVHTGVHIERLELSPDDSQTYGFSHYEGPVVLEVRAVPRPMDLTETVYFPETTVTGTVTIPSGESFGELDINVSPDIDDREYDIYITGSISAIPLNSAVERMSTIVKPVTGAEVVFDCGSACPPKRPYYLTVERDPVVAGTMKLSFIARPSTPAETGYQVQYRVNGTTTWTDGATRGPATAYNTVRTLMTQSGLVVDTKYDFRVKAINLNGESFSKIVTITNSSTWARPSSVRLTVSAPCTKHPTITVKSTTAWLDTVGAAQTNFSLYRGSAPPLTLVKEWIDVKLTQEFTITDTSIPVGGTYYYHVRSWNPGNEFWSEPAVAATSVTCASGGSGATPPPPTGSPDLLVQWPMTFTWYLDPEMNVPAPPTPPQYGYPYAIRAVVQNVGSVKSVVSKTKWRYAKCATPAPSGCVEGTSMGFEEDAPALNPLQWYVSLALKRDGEVLDLGFSGARQFSCQADFGDKIGDKLSSNNTQVMTQSFVYSSP